MEQVAAHGPPLGVVATTSYDGATAVHLETGDALVLVTDGFYEWPNSDGEMYGIERLAECVRTAVHQSSGGLIDAMRRALEKHARSAPQTDDLTTVVIKRA